MQHVIIDFKHRIQDLIPWCELIQRLRGELATNGVGEFVGDDMAIDGGDCEAVFRGADADALWEFLRPQLLPLSFVNAATTRVDLVYGDLESSARTRTFSLSS
jgi:hypothetical protein